MSLSTSLEGSHGDKLGNRGGFFNWDQSIKPPVACKYITFPVIDVSGRMPLCSTDYALSIFKEIYLPPPSMIFGLTQ